MNDVSYRLQSEGTLLVLVTGARFTTDELFECGRRALQDPAAKPPLKVLVDNRGSQENASNQEVERRVAQFAKYPELLAPRVAVVVSDDLHHGISRMAGAHLEEHGVTLAVFRDFDEALRWLQAV